MFVLEDTFYAYLLLVIPVMIGLFLLVQYWRRRAVKRYAMQHRLSELIPLRSRFKPWLKTITLCTGILFITVALINPQAGTELETIKREGVDIVFAVDVSKSMLAEDIAPDRLQKTQQLVNQILNNLASDRVGLIAYAGSAVPQLPITTDYNSARMFLSSLDTELISSKGTAIAEALQLANGYFGDGSEAGKVLVIISDGEDHAGEALEMAEKVAESGIKIITIGVGTPRGGPIPIKRNGVTSEYKKDRDGNTVITKLNPETLREIAEIGNGAYLDGTVTAKVIEQLRDELEKVQKSEFDSQEYSDYKSQYQWFLGIGIFLVLLDIFYLERRTKWIQQLNLFNE